MGQPFLKMPGNELGSVVAAQMDGCAVKGDQSGERRDDLAGSESAAGDHIEAIMAVLVDDRQELDRGAAIGGVEDDVDAPDIVDRDGLSPSHRAVEARWGTGPAL